MQGPTFDTPAGPLELYDYHFEVKQWNWSVWQAGVIMTMEDEERAVAQVSRVPYGVSLWSGAIVLSREIVRQKKLFVGKRVLELGSGVGLPGIVAATLGASVVQTDGDPLAVELARRNGARNEVSAIEHRPAHWAAWDVADRFDWIIGSDILYGNSQRPQLRPIFEANIRLGGRVLWTNPRSNTVAFFMNDLYNEGWQLKRSRWFKKDEFATRPIQLNEFAWPDSLHPDGPGEPS